MECCGSEDNFIFFYIFFEKLLKTHVDINKCKCFSVKMCPEIG